jgi:hypothetical protein
VLCLIFCAELINLLADYLPLLDAQLLHYSYSDSVLFFTKVNFFVCRADEIMGTQQSSEADKENTFTLTSSKPELFPFFSLHPCL